MGSDSLYQYKRLGAVGSSSWQSRLGFKTVSELSKRATLVALVSVYCLCLVSVLVPLFCLCMFYLWDLGFSVVGSMNLENARKASSCN